MAQAVLHLLESIINYLTPQKYHYVVALERSSVQEQHSRIARAEMNDNNVKNNNDISSNM